jgi:predicted amidohydrolase YtcJ
MLNRILAYISFLIIKYISKEIAKLVAKKILIKAIRCGNLIDGTGSPAIKDALIVIESNKIKQVGSFNEIKVPASADFIDARGKTVVPGLIDSHTHFLSMGYRLTHLDLSKTTSIKEIVESLENYIEKRNIKPGRWVQGRAWDDQNLAEKRYPTRHDLDRVSPVNPVALTRICGHMIVLNSKALEACNITSETSNPPGGVIDKDEQGEPTGILRDARSLISPHIPPPTYEDLRQGLRDAVDFAHSLGATGIHDASRPDEQTPQTSTTPYVDAHRDGELRLRCHVMTGYPREPSGDEWLSFGTLKIGIDGSMGAQTALLYEPYSDNPETSGVYVGDKELNKERVREAHSRKGILAIHAIGDKAITEAIDRIEEVISLEPRSDHRYRIEHYEYPTDEDIERSKKLGIIASMQPNFVGEWGWPKGMYDTRVGEERLMRCNPYRKLIDYGFHIPFGSDGMPFHPLYGIWSAVNHPIGESRISVEEAVKCYTYEGAYATREEDFKGTIEPGKVADITILPLDITAPDFRLNTDDPAIVEAEKRRIKELRAHITIINGETVYHT